MGSTLAMPGVFVDHNWSKKFILKKIVPNTFVLKRFVPNIFVLENKLY